MQLTIIRSAMVEAVGLSGGAFYLITGDALAFAGTGLALAVLLATFPTAGKFRGFAIDFVGLDRAVHLLDPGTSEPS